MAVHNIEICDDIIAFDDMRTASTSDDPVLFVGSINLSLNPNSTSGYTTKFKYDIYDFDSGRTYIENINYKYTGITLNYEHIISGDSDDIVDDCYTFVSDYFTTNSVCYLINTGTCWKDEGLTTNLIFLWDLEETSGLVAYDSHNSNNGTIGTDVTLDEIGFFDRGFLFGSDGNNIKIVDVGSETFSISLWYYFETNSNSTYDRLFGHSGYRIDLAMNSFGEIKIYDGTWRPTSLTAIINSWNHIVVTKNTTGYVVYLNYDDTFNYTITRTISSTDDLFLGSNFDSSQGCVGIYDQIALWNSYLSSSLVKILYSDGYGVRYFG